MREMEDKNGKERDTPVMPSDDWPGRNSAQMTAGTSRAPNRAMPVSFHTFVVTDVIELYARGRQLDGVFGIGGCDKTIPGTVMGMARLDLPSVFAYGGTIRAGRYRGQPVDIVSASEAVGSYARGAPAKFARLVSSASEGAVTS